MLSPGVMSAELATNASTSWAGPAVTVSVGQPLSEALDALRTDGLSIVYSTALVAPDLRVQSDRGQGQPRQSPRPACSRPMGSRSTGHAGRLRRGARQRAASLSAKAGPASAAPAVRESLADAPLEQVSVYASRYRVDPAQGLALVDLTRAEIEALPGLDEDVLRVMRYLPGTATNGVSARANVRGGRDNELAVYFDGVPLFEPFHFKDYQGLLGVLDPGAIARLDFFSGVFPARFGDRLSGVLDLAPRRPEAGADHHELGLSLLYAHALSVGEREWRDQSVEWLVSLRQSTVEPALKAAGRDSGVDPDFLDGLGRVELRIGERARLSAGFLMLNDTLKSRRWPDSSEKTESRYRDGTGWLGWQAAAPAAALRLADRQLTERHTERSGSAGAARARCRSRSTTIASSVPRRCGSRRRGEQGWTLGLEATDVGAHFDYAAQADFDPLLAAVFGRRASQVRATSRSSMPADGPMGPVWLGAAASRRRAGVSISACALDRNAMRSTAPAALAPGGRFDDEQWSPRLAVEYQWDDDTVLRASAGRVTQTERPDELQVPDGEPAVPSGAARHAVRARPRAPTRAPHLAARRGLSQERGRSCAALREPARPRGDPAGAGSGPRPRRARFLAGVWRRADPALAVGARWAGWLTYSRSEATDYFDGVEVPRSWNQLNSFNGGVSWTRTPWQLSANLTWHDGWRRSEIAAIPDSLEPDGVSLSLAPRNASTWENYFSLDLRTTWSIPVRWGSLRFYGEINNVTNRGNDCCEAVSLLHSPGMAAQLQRRQSGSLPRYALVGLSWSLP